MRTDGRLEALRPALAAAAQEQYSLWQQDADGECPVNGTGGICHHVADAMALVLGEAGIDAQTVCANDEVHVYCVASTPTGVWSVDVPWRLYEAGGGYTWTKKPDVELGPEDVEFLRLDSDPERAWMYRDQ